MKTAVDEARPLRLCADRHQCSLRQQRIGVKKQQHLAGRSASTGVHLSRASARGENRANRRHPGEQLDRRIAASAVDHEDLRVVAGLDFARKTRKRRR